MNAVLHTPIYPALFVAAIVIAQLTEVWVPAPAFGRPLLIAGIVALGIQLPSTWLGGRDRGALLAALVVILALDETLAALVIAIAALPLVWMSLRARRLVPLDWPRLTRSLNVIGAITFGVVCANAVNEGVTWPLAPPPSIHAGSTAAAAPDIYLILLDAYPRSDTLLEDFGYDNSPFLEAMEAHGFAVSEQARSNYNSTALTLASMLNARHITELMPDPPLSLAAQARDITTLINEGAAVTSARNFGYSVVAMPSPAGYLSMWAADRIVDPGHLIDSEWSILRDAPIGRLLSPAINDWAREQHRSRVEATLEGLVDLAAERVEPPRLVIAHILSPHPPFVFNADGSPSSMSDCFWELCTFEDPLAAETVASVRNQVAFINQRVAEVVGQVVEINRRPPVIVIFSDHGLRHDSDDADEMTRTLLMAYTPGRSALFSDDATPINILPRVLNAYLDAGLKLASEESYWLPLAGGANGFFPLEPVLVD